MFICLPEAAPAKGVSGKEISHSTPVMCKHPTVKPQRAHPEPRTPTPHFHSGEMLWQWNENTAFSKHVISLFCYQIIVSASLPKIFHLSCFIPTICFCCVLSMASGARAQLQRTGGSHSGLFQLDFSRSLFHWHRDFPLSVFAITRAGGIQLPPNSTPILSPLIISQLIQQGWVRGFIQWEAQEEVQGAAYQTHI